MTEPLLFSATARLRVPPAALWGFLSDTERLNRALDLPAVRFAPMADKGHYAAEARVLGQSLKYEEFPFDWVEGRHYRVLRRFSAGPAAEVSGGIRLKAVEEGTEVEVFARVIPRGTLAALLVRRFMKKKATGEVIEIARAFERHFNDPRHAAPGRPEPADLHPELLASRLGPLGDKGPVEKLRRHLLEAPDLQVMRMRPFEVADRWGEDRMEVLGLFLRAARTGALDLVWSVICPTCRVASREARALSQVKSQAHCDTCGIGFGADLARSVEARFTVNPAVRPARREIYCIGGPSNMPGTVAQLRLEPGETRREPFTAEGALRIRCYQAPGIQPLTGMKARVGADGLRLEPGEPGLLEVTNALAKEALVVVERETWREGAATAALVVSIQDFRDLFPEEAVAPGEELGVASLAVLFTDLKGSTDLYRKLGDAPAFSFVQNHFRYLTEAVARNRGGVVKTMGDAVMATFASGRDAVVAALEMQRGWKAFRESRGRPEDLALKIGIHQGPSIAINNSGMLDYFGTTVNMAARVQAQSQGDDLVVSAAVAEDPEARPLLEKEGLVGETFRRALKGLDGDHELRRVRIVKF